jgi:hypothetical protein
VGAARFRSRPRPVASEEGGGLSAFAVLDDKLGAPDVVKCTQEKTMSIEFPKVDPKTPCVQLVHPMAFP